MFFQPRLLRLLPGMALFAGTLLAADNPYDVVAKMTRPLLNPFLESPAAEGRAFRMVLALEEGGSVPAELARRRLILSVEAPDKVRIDTLLLGERITLCRNGESVWGWPGARIRPLLERVKSSGNGKGGGGPTRFGPLRLPVNDEAVVFLPALLQVSDRGFEPVADTNCRVLDLELTPQLAGKTGASGFVARAWARADDARPVRIQLRGPAWSGSLRFEEVSYQASLPADTWAPEAAIADDVVQLSAGEFLRLANSAIRQARLAAKEE